jgi:aspartyl-tRNA(Asn)/glutamyl-tRNA(Gln) amidotransferase subunit C
MKITTEDVLRVAELAHLELTPEEVETYRGQLDEILSYIAKLEELDVAAVEPMAQVIPMLGTGPGSEARAASEAGRGGGTGSGGSGTGVSGDEHPEWREDVVQPCDYAEAVLAQAPEAKKPFFRVPRVIGK